jgi:hypothetical protein
MHKKNVGTTQGTHQMHATTEMENPTSQNTSSERRKTLTNQQPREK